MTKEEYINLCNKLEEYFDVVRIVDSKEGDVYYFKKDGELVKHDQKCFNIWEKNQRCLNCISFKAHSTKTKITKFEILNDEIYYVISKHIVIDNKEFNLELVNRISEGDSIDKKKKEEFIKTILNFEQEIYVDPLTKTYNRKYLEDYAEILIKDASVAMLDIDNYKKINDRYGHLEGDNFLSIFAKMLLDRKVGQDKVIRYGGDEFIIISPNKSKEEFNELLHVISNEVKKYGDEHYKNEKITVSIGALYKANSKDDIFTKADALLYDAKRKKNSIIIN